MGSDSSEIFLGLVAPVGVDLDKIDSLLNDYFKQFDYESHPIRLSSFFSTPATNTPEYDRIDTGMTAGNTFRKNTGQMDILARHSVLKIQEIRKSSKQENKKLAYVLRSLKRPEEAAIFRFVYDKGFFLLGFSSSQEKRLKYLMDIKGMKPDQALKLIERDEAEGDLTEPGQQTRNTFHMADVFFNVDRDDFERHLKDFMRMIFGFPYRTPTSDEFAMFLAFSASFRSGDLSRQVGAVITCEKGEVIATGCNDVPKKGGGLYWEGDKEDKRDFIIGFDSNEKKRNEMVLKIVSQLERCCEIILDNKGAENLLKDSGIYDITEYGRAVHAEMEALLACGRSGVSPRNGTLFTTTFPCHNCAKHIVASGIARVVFIEPYPKSKALELHNDSISIINEDTMEKVVFQPFIGIGPRRFIDLFSMQLSNGIEVKRKKDGQIIAWKEQGSVFRFPLLKMDYLAKEVSIGDEIKQGEE